MNKSGPIVVIDDDADDSEILAAIFQKLDYPNEIVFFSAPQLALSYLRQPEVHPFIILSDINIPAVDGMQLRTVIFSDKALKEKCAAYILITTAVSKEIVTDLYARSIQGIFEKPHSLAAYESAVKRMVEYWQTCLS